MSYFFKYLKKFSDYLIKNIWNGLNVKGNIIRDPFIDAFFVYL